MERRAFLKAAAGAGAAAIGAASAERLHGANDRVRLALIGCGGRGRRVTAAMLESGGVELATACDVWDQNAARARGELGGAASSCRDFRRVLDDRGIDAVVIATPDHWHAIPAVLACRARKHVYLEKPLAHNVREGQAVVRAAEESSAVFLAGLQHRSAPHFAAAAELVRSGRLRDVHQVRIWNHTNDLPAGIGSEPDSAPPDGLDWDLWLGPAPHVPFNRRRVLPTFRAFADYAGGRITDFGTHRFDSVHQVLGADSPRGVSASGGRFTLGGMGDHPDLLVVTYEYPGFVLVYETSSINSFGAVGRITPGRSYYGAGAGESRPNGIALHGANGTLLLDRTGWELIPDEPSRRGRTGGPAANGEKSDGGSVPPAPLGPPLERSHGDAADATAEHARHFIRCIRDGEKPRCDARTAHRSTLVAHLGNIAYRTGRKLEWDGAREELRGAPEASALLGRRPRAPWDEIAM